MRSLVYFVAATLDGYIAGADRGDPDFSRSKDRTSRTCLPSSPR